MPDEDYQKIADDAGVEFVRHHDEEHGPASGTALVEFSKNGQTFSIERSFADTQPDQLVAMLKDVLP